MESVRNSFTFLQLSDAHLDSVQSQRLINFTAEEREARRQNILETMSNAFAEAKKRSVDAVLIPGGLFDLKTIRKRTIAAFIDLIRYLENIPVVISPGASDPFVLDSFYNSGYLEACGLGAWPDNCMIFRSSVLSSIPHPRRMDVTFFGMAYSDADTSIKEPLSRHFDDDDQSAFRILLLQGVLPELSMPDCLSARRSAAIDRGRFSLNSSYKEEESATDIIKQEEKELFHLTIDDLVNKSFTYAALGGYHHYQEVRDHEDSLIGAYSGCPVGNSIIETGPRGVVFGTINIGTDEEADSSWNTGPIAISLEKIEYQRGRMVSLDIEVSNSTCESIISNARHLFHKHACRPDRDTIILRLTGSMHCEEHIDSHEQKVQEIKKALNAEFDNEAANSQESDQNWKGKLEIIDETDHACMDTESAQSRIEAERNNSSDSAETMLDFVDALESIVARQSIPHNYENELSGLDQGREVIDRARRIGIEAISGQEVKVTHAD